MSGKRLYRWAVGTGFGLLLGACFVCCGCFGLGMGQPYRSWYGVGPVQVLGGPDEAWLFMERNIVVEHPPRWAEHSACRVGCRQQVVVFTPQGVKDTIAIPEMREVTFHRNISRVFRQKDGFYLLHDPSMSWEGALLHWEGDHFELLPSEAYTKFLEKYGRGDGRVVVLETTLDRLTQENGWKLLLAEVDTVLMPFRFSWWGQRFELTVERGPGLTEVRLRSTGPGREWDAAVLSFDPTPREITRTEYQELRAHDEPGYRK